MAGLGWIHFSETTRKQVLKIIDILGEPGTIDELGIGVVRNSFSNELFKGISTIMTRARYYYFVPYLMIDYLREKQKLSIAMYMNKAEMDLLENMTRKYENPEKERIIGYTIAKRNNEKGKRDELVRKPSEIYWGGIREYGIFKKDHSFGQLCDSIQKGNYVDKAKDNRGSDKEYGDDDTKYEKWADLFDVPYRSDWDKLDMSLSIEEAEHLQKHISQSAKGGFLTIILKNEKYIAEFLELQSFRELLDSELYKGLTQHFQQVVKTAVQFWELLEGAHIRFNILLQAKQKQTNSVSFDNKWTKWEDYIMNNFIWADFDREFLWEIVYNHSRINSQTRSFIEMWFNAIEQHKPVEYLDKLVTAQEKGNKKERSKLLPTHNENYTGWVGIDRLDYRLSNAKTIVRDIATSLKLIQNA
jgi:hypothetical protein